MRRVDHPSRPLRRPAASPRRALAAAAVLTLAGLLGACGRSPLGLGLYGGAGGGSGQFRCGTRDEDFFAATVLGYDPRAGGGQPPERDDVVDPAAALGPPDHQPTPPLGTVSIGDGGTLTLGFGSCVLVTGPGPDVVVHEAGFDERVFVAVRPTPETLDDLDSIPFVDDDGFIELSVSAGSSGELDIDLDLVGSGPLRFDAVRLRDVSGQGLETVETPGADIDALSVVDVEDADR